MEDKQKLALIISFYFSKFSEVATGNLGFKSFSQAFSEIGRILDVKPNTIKNMREQFDPYHNNTRVGWYQRPLSQSRQDVMNQFGNISEPALREIVMDILKGDEKSIIMPYVKNINEPTAATKDGGSLYSTRGVTGKFAEELFVECYERGEIMGFSTPIRSTTLLGTGYDFEMLESPGYVFEVKGLRGDSGGVLFTDKERQVAELLKEKYFLILFYNMDINSELAIVQDPFNKLSPKMQISEVVSVNWQVGLNNIKEIVNP